MLRSMDDTGHKKENKISRTSYGFLGLRRMQFEEKMHKAREKETISLCESTLGIVGDD